jgi:hypothetical protein
LNPTEYKDKNLQDKTIKTNEFTFPYYGSFVYWATKGYAVLDDASFLLLVKEPRSQMTILSQLVDNAE